MIILMIVYFIVGAVSTIAPGAFARDIIAIILSTLVVSFVSTPMMFMIFAKGYNVLKGGHSDEVVVSE